MIQKFIEIILKLISKSQFVMKRFNNELNELLNFLSALHLAKQTSENLQHFLRD